MGLEHLNGGFLLHLLNEQSEHNILADIYLLDSMDRQVIREAITEVRSGQMTFTRDMYEAALKRRKETGILSIATEPVTTIES